MPVTLQSVLLLTVSNVFMSFAQGGLPQLKWYFLWAALCLVGAVYFMSCSAGRGEAGSRRVKSLRHAGQSRLRW